MYEPCGAAREVLACSMIKIYGKIKRVGTLKYQVHWLSDRPMRWHQWCMLV